MRASPGCLRARAPRCRFIASGTGSPDPATVQFVERYTVARSVHGVVVDQVRI